MEQDQNANGVQEAPSTPSTPSLRGIPIDVRLLVWEFILVDIISERGGEWYRKPKFDIINYMLTCRQFHAELHRYLPRQLVPFNILGEFTAKVSKLPSHILAEKYRSITVQFELGAHPIAYHTLIKLIGHLRPYLEELRLYFRGCDRYDTSLYVHDCAYVTGQSSANAPLDGQRATAMLAVQRAIQCLTKLRILVISNMNAQIYPAMFEHKPKLEWCHLTTDPRSMVHLPNVTQLGLFAKIPTEYFPRIKVLQISANNMLNAFSLPSNCALTLQHLTWTIPNAVRGSNPLSLPIFQNTEQLMDNLFMNARRLKTLRICFQGLGSHGRPNEFLNLQSAVTEKLHRLSSLRDVEFHICVPNQNLGHDILRSLPSEVERFYANAELVRPQQLFHFVTENYLFATQGEPVATTLARRAQLSQGWYPQSPGAIVCAPTVKVYINPWIDPVTYKPWMDPVTNESVELLEHNEPFGPEIFRKISMKPKSFFVYGTIGEDLRRNDYIPLRNGNLKFITYEFTNPDYKCRTGGIPETTTQMVLRLNGRLLDRERNRHLSAINPGDPIKPVKDVGQSLYVERAFDSENRGIRTQLQKMLPDPNNHGRDTKRFINELMSSHFTDDKRYFGSENEAMKVFREERVARPEELPPLSYPYFEDAFEKDDKCHWLCPDANVPTLTQIDKLRAIRLARLAMIRAQRAAAASANVNGNGNVNGNSNVNGTASTNGNANAYSNANANGNNNVNSNANA